LASAHIGIYGHSQGATFAPLVATRADNLDFVIAASAGGLLPADVETYSVENSIGVSRLASGEQADARSFVHALIDVAYRGKDRALLAAMAAKYKGREWYFDAPPLDDSYWAISRLIASFEPSLVWRQVRARVLLLYGAHDERVPPVEGANAILAALKAGGNTRVTLKNYPTADHAFLVVDPPNKSGWPKHVPDYAETLTQWILSAK
jgi:pimeloyl-ACP methyl ester carboxylesterase